jgi:selenide,water dikinase
MAGGGAVSLRIDHQKTDYLPGAIECARQKFFSGGLKNNRSHLQNSVRFAPSVPEEVQELLFDPLTSGGLLVALAPEFADPAVQSLRQSNVPARLIGEVLPRQSTLIEVI